VNNAGRGNFPEFAGEDITVMDKGWKLITACSVCGLVVAAAIFLYLKPLG